MTKYSVAAILLALTLFSAPGAFADSGSTAFSNLFKRPTNVAIKNEIVKIDVGEKSIKVDCNCVFQNSGPACSMRIGFGDYGARDVPRATVLTDDSWVNGKKVKTALMPQSESSFFSHNRKLSLNAKSDYVIHDIYTVSPDPLVDTENGICHQISYAFRTAAFLHAPIEQAEIIVHFAPNLVSNPICPRFMYGPGTDALRWSSKSSKIVYYHSGLSPVVEAGTLRFASKGLEPAGIDDLHLYYGYTGLIQE